MQLPEGNEPLILADGTKINPANGSVIKEKPPGYIEVPSPSKAQEIIARTKRSVVDLPLPPERLSGVGLVAFYTLFGLNDRDISVALDGRLTIEQIENVRKLEAYQEFMETAKANILYTEQQTVRELFEKHAHNSAAKIIELSQSENDVMALTASKDVLDRAGHRPADVVEHRHKMEDALNIVVIKRDETKREEIPTIDVTPERIVDVTGTN